MFKTIPVLIPVMLLASACGTDYEIEETTLTGVVGGQDWSFVAGHTSAFLSENGDEFFAILYSEDFEECGFGEPSGDKLIVSIPKEPGTYDFSLSLNMTFVHSGENLVATKGLITVDEVTATNVRGGLVGDFNGSNEVNGKFDITLCSE